MQKADGQEETDRRFSSLLLLSGILVVAVVLRFYDLDRTSFWYDEAVSWSQSKGSFSDLIKSVAADNYPPLHNVLLWLTMPVIGDDETALRLPSAILGVVAVWLMYLIGGMLGGRTSGLLAAALLAVSPFHIWYSTEARMYALLTACGLAFLLSLMNVLKRPSGGWFMALALSGALFLYSHIYALLGFAPIGLLCAIYAMTDVLRTRTLFRSRPVIACIALGLSTLAFLPWLIILAGRARSVAEEGFWIAYPDLPFLKNMIFNMSGALTFFWLLAGLALFFVLRTLIAPDDRHSEPAETRQRMLMLLAYTAGPFVLAYLYSILVQPILFDRYLIAAWPGLLLLASAGAQSLLPRLFLPAIFFASLVLTYPQLKFTLLEKIRPEWREIARNYMDQRAPEDRLILYKGFAAPALEYYLREPGSFETAAGIEELQVLAGSANTDRHWLLIVHSDVQETEMAMRAFDGGGAGPAAQRFGWGASGLKLLHPHSSQ